MIGGRSAPIIIGAGLAGLSTALRLAEVGIPCTVLAAGPWAAPGPSRATDPASSWAQGGIAAAMDVVDDPSQHAADTLAAGAGLCDPQVVSEVTAAAPEMVRWLTGLGARFDRHADGSYATGLEGGHGRHRIVHAGGDGSGAEIMRAVRQAVLSTDSIQVIPHAVAARLQLDEGGQICAVLAHIDGRPVALATDQVVLATGGAGALWAHSTNPGAATGSGLALAARAGAVLRDLEMVQFHPTALDVGLDPMPLVSEAVRGEGAFLVDEHRQRLVPDDLATRDVISRAIWTHLREGGRVGLDVTGLGMSFATHFPRIAQACRAAGVDPSGEPIPVRPAAHYHCGGVLVDRHGRTSVPGLWAVGEVSSTGLHGANRLASNSLLEAAVGGQHAALDLLDQRPAGRTLRPLVPLDALPPAAEDADPLLSRAPWNRRPEPAAMELRRLLDTEVGMVRDDTGLGRALDRLESIGQPDDTELIALLVARAALVRRESRGGHHRSDYPVVDDLVGHTLITPTPGAAQHAEATLHTVPPMRRSA